jgi:hypothetical protein
LGVRFLHLLRIDISTSYVLIIHVTSCLPLPGAAGL